jgi:hypothetical protein
LRKDGLAVCGLNFWVAIVNKEKTGSVEAESIKAVNDRSEAVELTEDVRNVVGED